jgi:hypothetical protein
MKSLILLLVAIGCAIQEGNTQDKVSEADGLELAMKTEAWGSSWDIL